MIVSTQNGQNLYGEFESVIENENQTELVCKSRFGSISIIPLSVIGDYELLDLKLPEGNDAEKYSYDGSKFTKKTVTLKLEVPHEVPMWKARAVLIKAGLLDTIDGFFNQIPDPIDRKLAQSKFEFSIAMQRNEPLVEMMRVKLGMSQSDIDNLFIQAEKI